MTYRAITFILVSLVAIPLQLCINCGGDTESTGPNNPTTPVLTTSSVSAVTQISAQCGGTITTDGGSVVTARGVCWSTSANPTINDEKTTDGAGTGSFASSIIHLNPGTVYQVRAYAANSEGTGYGNTVQFTSLVREIGSVTDIDGNTYNTVKIGDQWWMAENLSVTHYRNGDPITIDTADTVQWSDYTAGAYCNHGYEEPNGITYGRLYNWLAVVDNRSIAPTGWHIPSDAEWKQMEIYLGMSQAEADHFNWRGSSQGCKLKEAGEIHWGAPNACATDEVGFSALPGGYRAPSGIFSVLGEEAVFWTSTEYYTDVAFNRYLSTFYGAIGRQAIGREAGYSVRCVKD